jgi:hypothetical protein
MPESAHVAADTPQDSQAGDFSPDSVITIVHGTWARHSPLADPDSDFCRDLIAGLSGRAVVRAFLWSGRNRHADRLAAAKQLKAHVLQGIAAHPGARHFLVGHSHGGNVAFYALRDEDFAAKLAGVITLETPFIHVHRRPLPLRLRRYLDRYSDLAAIYPLMLSAPFVLVSAIVAVVAVADRFWPLGIGAALVSLLSGAAALRLIRTLRGKRTQLSGNYWEVEELLQLPQSVATRVLIVTSSADEATGVLTASSFLSWLSTRLVGGVVLLFARMREKISYLPAVVAILSLPFLAADWISRLWPQHHRWQFIWEAHAIAQAALHIVAAPIYIGAFFIWVLSMLCWLAARPFGPEIGVRGAMFLRVSAEASPAGGPWSLYNVPPPTVAWLAYGDTWEWMHRQGYSDARAIEFMCEWIEQGSSSGVPRE